MTDAIRREKLILLVEDVFRFTLDSEPITFRRSSKVKCLVYLRDLSSLVDNDIADIDTLKVALFERLVLPNPRACVIDSGDIEPNVNSKRMDVRAVTTQCCVYLFQCYKTVAEISELYGKDAAVYGYLDKLMDIIVSNCSTILLQPLVLENELSERQDFSAQIRYLMDLNTVEPEYLAEFMRKVCSSVLHEEKDWGEACKAVAPFLRGITQHVMELDQVSMPGEVLAVIYSLLKIPEMTRILLRLSTPGMLIPKDYEKLLLGSLLNINPMPTSDEGPASYFRDNGSMDNNAIVRNNLWSTMERINEENHRLFRTMLKDATNRDTLLRWIGTCIDGNLRRKQLMNLSTVMMNLRNNARNELYISDGFSVNLCTVMLKLCEPFIRNMTKLLKVDPTYCAASIQSDGDMDLRGVHLRKLNSETCLVPLEDGEVKPGISGKYNFMTECFFMTHRAIEISFQVGLDKMVAMSHDITQIQDIVQRTNNETMINLRPLLDGRLRDTYSRYMTYRCALLVPETVESFGKFIVASCKWLIQVYIDDANHSDDSYAPMTERTLTFPLPEYPPMQYKCIPEFVLENICCYLVLMKKFNIRALEENAGAELEPLLTTLIIFMGSRNRVRNPHLRAHLAEAVECLLPSNSSPNPATEMLDGPIGELYRTQLFYNHPFRKQLLPSLLDVFVSIEMTGEGVQFEQKFNYRLPMYEILDYLWSIRDYKSVMKALARTAEAEIEATDPPLFLRFTNVLINDAIFLLDEAITNVSQLRELQELMEGESWNTMTGEDRTRHEQHMRQISMLARFDNILGDKTIETLRNLTQEIKSIFCHETIVDRMASMLNYFLAHLVGPKKHTLKIKDREKYHFDPGKLVRDICAIYVHLGTDIRFCQALPRDGRSYSRQLFIEAENVLVRVNGAHLVTDLRNLANSAHKFATLQEAANTLYADAPDEFLDPIMSTMMSDPVILPSSRKTVDRATIARHLLSDQTDPFTRAPLTMDKVTPNMELKEQIWNWVQEKNAKKETQEKTEKEVAKMETVNDATPSNSEESPMQQEVDTEMLITGMQQQGGSDDDPSRNSHYSGQSANQPEGSETFEGVQEIAMESATDEVMQEVGNDVSNSTG